MFSKKAYSKALFVLFALLYICLPGQAADKKASPDHSLPVKEASTSPEEKKADTKEELIDINTATAKELMSLKGIGRVNAQDIINGRPYAKKDQLKSRKILSDSMYEGIKDRIIAKQPPKKKQ